MRIFIAELSHTGHGLSPNTVPLAAGYLSSYAETRTGCPRPRIFRDPAALFRAAREERPDIVGFSVHTWSETLSNFSARRIKELDAGIITVAGGPSVPDKPAGIETFLRENPCYDLCIPNEGEHGFAALVESVMRNGFGRGAVPLDGCHWLSGRGLVSGGYSHPDPASIPSPYLDGTLDGFLAEGLEPVLQTMRGCPYSCRFCVSGTANWNRIRRFDLERSVAEFEYIRERTKSGFLIITDENLGLLRERDVALAETIIASYRKHGYPSRLYFYTAKIVTPHVLKIVELLSPLCEFGMSFQTLDDKVIGEIRRTNIGFEEFVEYVKWAAERNIVTSTEMIFGFPGETYNEYIKGLERLIRSGVNRVYSYNLRLLSGIDLATSENRRRYGFVTKFRMPERTYGIYEGEPVTEVEEVVVGCESFDYDDYLKVRKYGLFLELASGRGYLSELVGALIALGAPAEKLLGFLADYDFSGRPVLGGIVGDYVRRSREELFDTPDECGRHVAQLLRAGRGVPEVKLNFIFTGKIVLDPKARVELFEVIKEFVKSVDLTTGGKALEFAAEYLDSWLAPRIVDFRPGADGPRSCRTRINPDKLPAAADGAAFLNDEAVDYTLELHETAREFSRSFTLKDLDDEAALQNIYMTVSRFGLLRNARSANAF